MPRLAFLRLIHTVSVGNWLAAMLFAMPAMTVSTARAVYYSATPLPFPGFTSGVASDASSATRQVGYGKTASSDRHALMWDGTSANPIDLTPPGYSYSTIYGTSGANQAGSSAASGGFSHAMVWGTSAASAVDLHPATGYSLTEAYAVNGTSQVGYGQTTAGDWHALVWSGTAASKVDLHPSGFTTSQALDVSVTKQTGWARLSNGRYHAMLWTCTAASRVDLNPTNYEESQAVGIYATGPSTWKQVGFADSLALTNGDIHAMLWSSTAASKVDLHPNASFNFTETEALSGSLAGQVGYGHNYSGGGYSHALYWNGTAASCVDLHKYLGGLGNFTSSEAYGIADDGTIVGVAYSGILSTSTILHPVIWTPVTESGVPGDYNNDGKVDAGDYVIWRKYNGSNYLLMNEVAVATPSSVTQEDFAAWRTRYGNTMSSGNGFDAASIPEPTSCVLVVSSLICATSLFRLRCSMNFDICTRTARGV